MKASLFKPGTRKQVDVGHWFVQTIESVFGLKEADFEGTAARTPRAREGRQNGRSTRQPPSDPFRLVVSCKTRSVGPIDHALASEPPARRCRSWSCRRRGRLGAPSTDALHELRQRGIARCRRSPQIKMADLIRRHHGAATDPANRATASRAGNHSARRSGGFPFAGPDIGRYSGTRTHLCGEVGTGRQRGVISGYRLSRRVRALSAPWRCLDLLGSDWRAYDWCNSLGGLAR